MSKNRTISTLLIAVSLFAGLAACHLSQPVETEEIPIVPPSTLLPLPSSLPAPSSSPSAQKISLWIGGTHLRGANTWQRIVVPELDGPEFLGSGYIGPPYTQADFDALAALGANYVNLSTPGLFTERPPYVLDEQAQADLDDMIAMASQADLFVVISFRTGPGRSDFTFYRDDAGDWFDAGLLIETVWSDPVAQDAWVEMWRYTAFRYRASPVVIGYDLMCEPNSNAVVFDLYDPEEFYAQYTGSTYDWNQFYPRLVAGIRQVDTETPILVSALSWGALRWLPYLRTIDDPRIVYTVHQYEPQEQYTHQQPPAANTFPGEFDLDWDGEPDTFDLAWLEGFISIITDFRNEQDVPVAVNEFGVMRWVPGAADFMYSQMTVFENLGVSYALWVWNPAWAPWAESVTDFNIRFGSDPDNTSPVDNDLLGTIASFWSRNTVRPSSVSP